MRCSASFARCHWVLDAPQTFDLLVRVAGVLEAASQVLTSECPIPLLSIFGILLSTRSNQNHRPENDLRAITCATSPSEHARCFSERMVEHRVWSTRVHLLFLLSKVVLQVEIRVHVLFFPCKTCDCSVWECRSWHGQGRASRSLVAVDDERTNGYWWCIDCVAGYSCSSRPTAEAAG